MALKSVEHEAVNMELARLANVAATLRGQIKVLQTQLSQARRDVDSCKAASASAYALADKYKADAEQFAQKLREEQQSRAREKRYHEARPQETGRIENSKPSIMEAAIAGVKRARRVRKEVK